MVEKRIGVFTIGILNLLLGAYLINFPFQFIKIPGFFLGLSTFNHLIGGIFLVFAGYVVLKYSRHV